MNRLELIAQLSSMSEEDVYVKNPDDGYLYDFSIEHVDEQFDGFDEVYPACLAFNMKQR